MLAAESAFNALKEGDSVAETFEMNDESSIELTEYEDAVKKSWINDELYQVRNCHEAFARWGTGGGMVYTGLATHLTKGYEPWTLEHRGKDADKTQPEEHFEPIAY